MRRISMSLLSTSIIAIAVAASPAAAQTTDPATPPDPTVEAQEQPNDPEAGSAQTDDAVQTATGQDQATTDGEVIVVTGLRRSLQSAQNIKRNSEQIVDAIVAEDIGKLPDVTASAALARIPGVQVQRSAGEAAQVTIRGLPDISTTYNSREIFTANDRFVAIQDFPAGSVAALEVFKSSTANLIEGGLGGQVNVRGRKPFDFKGLEISGMFNVVKFEQSGEWDWNGNILVSNRWDVGDGGEIGVLVNAAMTNIDFFDASRENDLWVSPRPATAEHPAMIAPNGNRIYFATGNRWRPSLNAAIQYRPNSELEFYVDGLFQGYRGEDTNYVLFVPNQDCCDLLTDVTMKGGLPVSYRSQHPFHPDGSQFFFDAKTNTYQIGGGAIYEVTPDIRLSGDIAYTDSKFRDHNVNIDYAFDEPSDSFVTIDHENGPGGASVEFTDFDTTDPDNYLYRGLWENLYKATGEDIQARVDVEWTTGWTNLPRIQFGVRHNNRDATRQTGGTYRGTNWVPFSEIGLDFNSLMCGFEYDDYQEDKCFVGAKFDDVFDSLEDIRAFHDRTGYPDPDPLAGYTANEKTYAAYGQLRYEIDAGGMPIDGNIGLRVVRTKNRLTSMQLLTEPDPDLLEPITARNSYTDYLPNASMRIGFTRELQGRLAYTETRTRPTFNDLSPGGVEFAPPSECTTLGPDSPLCFVTVNAGNPDLKPIESKNYDATLEYYFAPQSALTFALFRRDVRGFVFGGSENIDADPYTIRLNAPFNSGKGKIQGFEIAATTFFDYDWLPGFARGFGVQGNYTYIDASTELAPNMQAQFPGQQLFPGVSKHAYNLVAMYERNNISARLAYNWRSKFAQKYEFTGDIPGNNYAPIMERSRGTLDFSASYTPFENITFAFDALNILAGDAPIRTYREFSGGNGATFPFYTKYLERVFSFGVRFRHGGRARAVEPAAPMLPPPPPPVAEPAPMVEPAPPPPPPPTGERG